MNFTNTDAGQLRRCIFEATKDTKIWPGSYVNIFNDNTKGRLARFDRRLKVWNYNPFIENPWIHDNIKPMHRALMAKEFRKLIDQTFGKRVHKLDISGGDILLYLNDDHGGPFKPLPSTKPKKALPVYDRPEKIDRATKAAFWAEVSNFVLKGDTEDYWKPQFVTLNQDIAVFKKVKSANGSEAQTIANMIVPAGTRVYVTMAKCRARKAEVVSMYTQKSHTPVHTARSGFDRWFLYETGKVVRAKGDDFMRHDECSTGIHFFVDVNEALDYRV